jgi:hypothetical protein
VPLTTNVCNLTLHPKATLEYLKPTPDKPNFGQKIFPTTTNTISTSTNRNTKHTNTMRRDTKSSLFGVHHA